MNLIYNCAKRLISPKLMVFTMLLHIVFTPASLRAELCGFDLSMLTEQETPEYIMGTPVKILMVIKNVSGFPLNTARGFGEIELEKALILTTPSGERIKYAAQEQTLDMPPPYFFGGLVGVPAESLTTNWVRTITIEDLCELFPLMKTTPGWYTLEAEQQVAVFAWSVQQGQLGLLGIDSDERNCRGNLSSNRSQIYIKPQSAARLEVKVLDTSFTPEAMLGQVQVKVYEGAVLPQNYSDVWAKGNPVLSGTTDYEGCAVWGSGINCIREPQVRYTAIALYGGEYRTAVFEAGNGWQPGCGQIISRQILFGEEPFPGINTFSLLASNSIWIQAGANIRSGRIGVIDQSPGLWLNSGVEVSVGLNARAEDGVGIYADSIKIWPNASVDEIYYNDLLNSGTIRGDKTRPLPLPLPVELPQFPAANPGTTNVTVSSSKTKTLVQGRYRDVSIGMKGTLILSGGLYEFRNINMGYGASILCQGESEVRIKDRLYPGVTSVIGPKTGSGLNAKNIVFHINGTNGSLLNLLSYPRAAEIGLSGKIQCTMFVPNGTLALGAGSQIKGRYFAKGLVLGMSAKAELE